MAMNLYKKEYEINEHISIKIPTVREIVDDEDNYYEAVSLIVSTPYDMMAQLADNNIDFTKINDWELFCLLFNGIKSKDLSLIFNNINLQDFHIAVNQQNGNVVLLNQVTGAVIDKAIHAKICRFLRRMLHIERVSKQPANEAAKKFMIERAKRRLMRAKRGANKSQLEDYIISLVNCKEFPYDYESVLDISIYQFYSSLHQISHRVKFDNLMIGCYAGTVNVKELDPKELMWIQNQ